MDDFGTYLLVLYDLINEELTRVRASYDWSSNDASYVLGKIAGYNSALCIVDDFLRRYMASSTPMRPQNDK